MAEKRMQSRAQKPLKMFIYQPVYLKEEGKESEEPKKGRPKKGKYVCCTITTFPYFRAEIGDIFTSEKRPADYVRLKIQNEFKAVAVRYNLREGACIVFVEDIIFDDDKELNRFVSDNQSA